LCLSPKSLRHSHIFPEFFYDRTYGDDGRFVAIRRDPTIKPRPFQKGLREYLLCSDCETAIGRCESYSSSLLRKLDAGVAENGYILHSSFDYTLFKLFAVSLIWRASVARNGFFAAARLGPFKERARMMLLSGDPGPPHQLGFALARVGQSAIAQTVVSGPFSFKWRGQRAYHFVARGYRWVYLVSGIAEQFTAHFPFIGATTELRVPILNESDSDFLDWMKKALPWHGR
jgi:hypothetical protein